MECLGEAQELCGSVKHCFSAQLPRLAVRSSHQMNLQVLFQMIADV